jgi:Retrotransposon gag protein
MERNTTRVGGFIRDMERRQNHTGLMDNNFRMLRIDFPKYDGGDPIEWKMNCEFYFEIYQVSEVYKIRMAVMHFSEEMNEWYRILDSGNQIPSWDLLVEEVSNRFKLVTIKHPVDEFKRLHQTGTMEEYIKRFGRVKAKLMYYDPHLNEDFYIQGFCNGFKEEVRHLVEILKPRKLNEAFNYAYKIELSIERQ